MKKINVALVSPPIGGHKFRGTGTYGEELFKALKRADLIDISWVKYGSDLQGFDLVHYPYFDPFFLTLPVVKVRPTAVTVHDLIPLIYPDQFPRGIRGEIKWFMQKLSLQGSRAVITDSLVSKADIRKFTGMDEEKIRVIYLGVRKEFKVLKSPDVLNYVRKKYHLPDNFILHVGDVNYNKNISGAIKAFSRLSGKHSGLYLVLVGRGFVEDSAQLRQLIDLISRLGLAGKVMRLGFIDLSDLVGVYNLAQVYLQLSYAEGFGLPLLEAMACGCPVIAGNLSSLPELAGDAAILVDPDKADKIALNISEIITDAGKRNKLIRKGLQRVTEFSWDKCARQTVEVYRQILK